MTPLHREIADCRLCEAHLPHGPRPVVQFSTSSRLVIIGQAPGSRVHETGVPWDDASGERLCEWTGLSSAQLHDPDLVALVPMGFCYPGKGRSGDLPPRRECAPQWHEAILSGLEKCRLTLLVGTYAQAGYLPDARAMTMNERVREFARFLPEYFPLPHPSWRSTLFMRRNPWFEQDVLPELRNAVERALART